MAQGQGVDDALPAAVVRKELEAALSTPRIQAVLAALKKVIVRV
jgi:hypothetical protein